jgi:Xaa-Pro aminopeptidase
VTTAEERRQERLRAALAERGLAGLAVSTPANVRYLTGYVGSNGFALIPAEGGAWLVTDGRYAVSARAQVRGAEVVVGERELLGDVARVVREAMPGGPVGVEADHLTLGRHERLRAELTGRELAPTRALVEDLRVVKDDDEVALVRAAADMADAALADVVAEGLTGRT